MHVLQTSRICRAVQASVNLTESWVNGLVLLAFALLLVEISYRRFCQNKTGSWEQGTRNPSLLCEIAMCLLCRKLERLQCDWEIWYKCFMGRTQVSYLIVQVAHLILTIDGLMSHRPLLFWCQIFCQLSAFFYGMEGAPIAQLELASCLIWIGPALCTICVCFNSVCVLFWELFSSLSGVLWNVYCEMPTIQFCGLGYNVRWDYLWLESSNSHL